MHKINWRPSEKDLRWFGLVLWVGFGLIGMAFYKWSSPQAAYGVWATAGAVGFLAIVAPPLAKPFYWLWMGFGFCVGTVVSKIIFLVIFYLILTPVALIFKIKGRDALRLKKRGESYWSSHPSITDPRYYEHLF